MPKMVTITVDGATIQTPEGTSVLDAALEAGICIPNLCHMPGVSPIGACRVCIVEVVEGDRRKMTASCTLEAREGLVVEAHSDGGRARPAEHRRAAAGRGPQLPRHPGPGRPRGRDALALSHAQQRLRPLRPVRARLRRDLAVAVPRLRRAGQRAPRGAALRQAARPLQALQQLHRGLPDDHHPLPGTADRGASAGCANRRRTMVENIPDTCVMCELGRGFQCARWQLARSSGRPTAPTTTDK